MRILKTDLANAVYALSGNKVHDFTIDFVADMYAGRAYHNLDHVEAAVREARHFFNRNSGDEH